jgi:hypothetical protein
MADVTTSVKNNSLLMKAWIRAKNILRLYIFDKIFFFLSFN